MLCCFNHSPTVLQINLLYLENGACRIGVDWSFMLTWETNIIIGWFDLVVSKKVVVNSIRGWALLRFVSPQILLGLHIFENIGVLY